MGSGYGGTVVLDGRGDENLSSPWGVEGGEFVGGACEATLLAGAPEAPDGCEWGELPVGGPLLAD